MHGRLISTPSATLARSVAVLHKGHTGNPPPGRLQMQACSLSNKSGPARPGARRLDLEDLEDLLAKWLEPAYDSEIRTPAAPDEASRIDHWVLMTPLPLPVRFQLPLVTL